eukprot:c16116_g2_i1.p1 GENE.c16116_g2_i1~~c16116_g2_i1.p1  ORF type:complete len:105 (-),score=31.31 c16116_g2_i1:37-351(-)
MLVIKDHQEFLRLVNTTTDKLIVVDFFATWCGPCVRIAPEFERMAAEFSDVIFVKIDADENGETAEAFSVESLPTFLFFKNKAVVYKVTGADTQALRAGIQSKK